MSRTLVQPVGQKRLTNVAVVRLKKHGNRFEIACYKNKVLSWRSGVEKDLDEVLQSQIIYTNVGKGVLAKSKDLKAAFGMDDQTKICLEILEKGELQVAGKERESQLSNQFRDIATIVLQKTINPETQRPYTITMIERLMHEVHFAVDPHSSSKKQALDVIRELEKHFPIKRSPMRLRLTLPQNNYDSLAGKLSEWKTTIVSKDESGSQLSVAKVTLSLNQLNCYKKRKLQFSWLRSGKRGGLGRLGKNSSIILIVCEIEPGLFRDCDALVRNLQGRSEILAISVHGEGDFIHEEDVSSSTKQPIDQLTEEMRTQTLAPKMVELGDQAAVKQKKCSTCDAIVGDATQYREHFKSDWHKHNLKRKTRQLPPISAQECMADEQLSDAKGDLTEYSF
ncbi:hypothetical protein SSX86_031768 [Deinandra increscens subsp. villosa]|uniref:Ribosome maturation protein SBDS n=1 Tax=Deinandra increscens subsp. villosa TaxID=3103831 RepID=A0AAP0C8H4_9ASTR